MAKAKTSKILDIILPILTVVCIIIIWLVSAVKINESLILPKPDEVFLQMIKLLKTQVFYKAYFLTILRSIIAFAISFVLAFALAYLTRTSANAKRIIKTLIPLIRALPTIAIVLLLLIWTNSNVAPIIVTMLVVLPTLYTALLTAILEIDSDLIEMCKVYNVSKKDRYFKVYLPQILPSVILAIGTGISLNIKLMVAAEVLSQTVNSLGQLMNDSKKYYETARLLALVIFSLLTGLIFESIGNYFSKKARARK